MKLHLYKVNNRYAFSVGKFSSTHHFPILPDIKPTYQYAWEAYRDAKKLYRKQHIHLDMLQKTAVDDLAIDDLSFTQESSAEQMILNHYSKIFAAMVERIKAFKDEEDKELAYEEIKGVVSSILKVKENLEKDSDKEKIDSILGDFRGMVKENFPKLLAKDKAEMEKSKESSPEEAPEVPSIPDATSGGIDNELGGLSLNEPPIMPMAQDNKIDQIIRYASNNLSDIRSDVLDEYAERVCKSIEKSHPDAVCKIDYKDGTFKVSEGENEPILKISVNEDLLIDSIEPSGDLSSGFPLHSLEFYQKYWKPIIEKVGHYLSKDLGVIICTAKSSLPDIPNSFPKAVKVMGWNIKEKEERPFEVHFCGEKPTWILKKVDFVKEAVRKITPSKYTEEDFIRGQPRRVKCIDTNQPSIIGKIGEVKQVIPLMDHIEIDVDFGGVIVRLTENQFEFADEIPSNT